MLKILHLADLFGCLGIEWEFLCVRKEALEERLTHCTGLLVVAKPVSVLSQNVVTLIISTKHTQTHTQIHG